MICTYLTWYAALSALRWPPGLYHSRKKNKYQIPKICWHPKDKPLGASPDFSISSLNEKELPEAKPGPGGNAFEFREQHTGRSRGSVGMLFNFLS